MTQGTAWVETNMHGTNLIKSRSGGVELGYSNILYMMVVLYVPVMSL